MKYSIRGISRGVGIDDVIGVAATCDEDYVFDGVEPVTAFEIIYGLADVGSIITDTKYFLKQTGTRARRRSRRTARLMKAQKWSQKEKAQYLFGDIEDTLPF